MAINPRTDTAISPYVPQAMPLDEKQTLYFLQGELLRLKATLDEMADAAPQVADVAPKVPRKGMVRYAVSPWNPGSGDGPYYYDGALWTALKPVTPAPSVRLLGALETGSLATGTTIIPVDNTIPQITEGDQYMTLTVTPLNAASTIVVDVTWNGANTVAGSMITVALFQNGGANAVAVGTTTFEPTANGETCVSFRHKLVPGGTAPITFAVRAGSTAGTTSFNGSGGVARYGGALASSIFVTEYLP